MDDATEQQFERHYGTITKALNAFKKGEFWNLPLEIKGQMISQLEGILREEAAGLKQVVTSIRNLHINTTETQVKELMGKGLPDKI